MEFSPEERKRRSERAKALHAAGKFGGPGMGQGRPSKKKRAMELVAQDIAGMATEMTAAIREGLDPRNSASTRLAAVESAMKIEKADVDRQLKEEQAIEAMSQQALIEQIIKKLGRISAVGALPDAFAGAIEAEVIAESDE
jgi:hypothetical protein